MMRAWRDGSHAPAGIDPNIVWESFGEREPTPENLFELSKNKKHVLHKELWSEGDQVWAQRGRMERCRQIVSSIVQPVVHGDRTIMIRSVEFVRTPNGDRWATIDTIRSDPDMRDAYIAEILRMQDQISAKLAKFREFIKAE